LDYAGISPQGDIGMTQDDSIAKLMVGIWDVYSPGMQTTLILQDNGQYMNTLYGGTNFHWGIWSILPSPLAIHFVIQGAEPKFYVGPLGSVPIQWPTSETWMIVDAKPDRVQIQGATMVKRQPVYPQPVSPPQPSQAAQAPNLADTIKLNQDTAQKLREAQQAMFDSMKKIYEGQKAAFDQANKAWSDYLKS
jgi:hypothetical protein